MKKLLLLIGFLIIIPIIALAISNNIWDNPASLGGFAGTTRGYHGVMIETKNESRIMNITKHSNTIATECGIFRVYDNVSLENASFLGHICQFTGNTILANNTGYRIVIKSTTRGYAGFTYPNNSALDYNIITGVYLSSSSESPPNNWENDSVNIVDIIQIVSQTGIPPIPPIPQGADYCSDNSTTAHNSFTYINNESFNLTKTEPCAFGCDNVSGLCSPAPYQQDIINFVIIVVIFIAGIGFIKILRSR